MSDASTKKREKILIGLASLAIVYLIITITLPSGNQEATSVADPPSSDMLSTISQGIGNLTNKEATRATAVLALAATPWKNVTFAARDNFTENTNNISNEATTSLSYTGYMGMGKKGQLAIINGKDYQQGDSVEGFAVKEITPASVLLEKDGVNLRVSIQTPVE